MRFTKMQGAGNDYVYVNCLDTHIPDKEALAIRVSNRNFGIGSDGLICICPSTVADFKMEMFNADGSEGAMCGNGIRCLGKYVYDKGLTANNILTVETPSGVRILRLYVKDGSVHSVRVDMGSPRFHPNDIPLLAEGEDFIRQPVTVSGRQWELTALSVGNPHGVLFLDEDVDTLNLEVLGPQFEVLPLFPKRVNTEFVNVIEPGVFHMRVWERGSGETLACGTGATAVCVAATLCGLCPGKATVHLRGGTLQVEWDRTENRLYLEGPAVTVFDGELYEAERK